VTSSPVKLLNRKSPVAFGVSLVAKSKSNSSIVKRPAALTTSVSHGVESWLWVDEDPQVSPPLMTVSGDGGPTRRRTYTIALFASGN